MIDIASFEHDALMDYDRMISLIAIEKREVCELGMLIEAEVLRELVRRGLAELVEGTMDDICNGRVRRFYAPER